MSGKSIWTIYRHYMAQINNNRFGKLQICQGHGQYIDNIHMDIELKEWKSEKNVTHTFPDTQLTYYYDIP